MEGTNIHWWNLGYTLRMNKKREGGRISKEEKEISSFDLVHWEGRVTYYSNEWWCTRKIGWKYNF